MITHTCLQLPFIREWPVAEMGQDEIERRRSRMKVRRKGHKYEVEQEYSKKIIKERMGKMSEMVKQYRVRDTIMR